MSSSAEGTGQLEALNVTLRGEQESAMEQILHNLSFNPAESDSSNLHISPVCESVETAKTEQEIEQHRPLLRAPQKRAVLPENKFRPKSYRVPTREEELEAIGMKYHWELESAFRKYLQQRLAQDSSKFLIENRITVVAEFQHLLRTSPQPVIAADQAAIQASKATELCLQLQEEMRYQAEVHQAQQVTARRQRLQKPMNWMHQQVQREKERLEKGLGKYVRQGASH